MTIYSFFLASPFFWVFFAAFFTGAAIKRIVQPVQKTNNREKAMNSKWVKVCILFSLTLVLWMCAFFVPGGKELSNIRYLYAFVFFVIISFFCLRFKRAFGILFFFLLMFSLLFLILFIRTLSPYTGETEIARVHVLTVKENKLVMELERADNRTEIMDMEGDYFSPVINVIILDDLLIFLGAKTWYRFTAMATYTDDKESEIPSPAETYEIQKKDISKELYDFIQQYEAYIPGIKSVRGKILQKKAKNMISYAVVVQPDGSVVVKTIE